MNKEPNIFPEINLFPRLKRVAEYIFGSLTFLPNEPLASHGDHFNTGAAPMLDDQLQLDYPDRKPDAGL